MQLKNIEIKARCTNLAQKRAILQTQGAKPQGTNLQKDTYFNVLAGRLKLRQGNIENALIYYERSNQDQPKRSDVLLYPINNPTGLEQVLGAALGVRLVVQKKREIWWLGNIKIHLDQVTELGEFIEVEAIDSDGSHAVEHLQQQCWELMESLQIQSQDLIANSYVDLLEQKGWK